jgi:hypothetical protein
MAFREANPRAQVKSDCATKAVAWLPHATLLELSLTFFLTHTIRRRTLGKHSEAPPSGSLRGARHVALLPSSELHNRSLA